MKSRNIMAVTLTVCIGMSSLAVTGCAEISSTLYPVEDMRYLMMLI
ncbi:MAG: hypothetical protein K5875_00670 [Saccharofermentans sp.]|nr:hypothetical protein [Saccharofermentans sp.]